MDVKEAIELVDCYFCKVISANEGKEIVALLQQGEKYRQMWGDISTMYKLPCYGLEGSKLLELVKFLEQKYFPKEVKQDEDNHK